jgi:hypothetical protein
MPPLAGILGAWPKLGTELSANAPARKIVAIFFILLAPSIVRCEKRDQAPVEITTPAKEASVRPGREQFGKARHPLYRGGAGENATLSSSR